MHWLTISPLYYQYRRAIGFAAGHKTYLCNFYRFGLQYAWAEGDHPVRIKGATMIMSFLPATVFEALIYFAHFFCPDAGKICGDEYE